MGKKDTGKKKKRYQDNVFGAQLTENKNLSGCVGKNFGAPVPHKSSKIMKINY